MTTLNDGKPFIVGAFIAISYATTAALFIGSLIIFACHLLFMNG